VRRLGALAAPIAVLILAGCSGGSERDELLERIEEWTTEDTILSVVRNHDPFNLGGPTFPDDLEEFVAMSSVASFWPVELPDGIVIRGAMLTLVEGEPIRLDVAFTAGEGIAEFQWRVVEGELDMLTPAGPDMLSDRDGVLIWRWKGAGLDLRIGEATGCGHSVLATFPFDAYSNEDIQRAVGTQFANCD
jgi:hypothetical protein